MDTSLQAKVDQLAQAFLIKLPARLDKMDAAFAQCRRDPANAEPWRELYRLLHSLGGAAGTFGVAELGLEARCIEEAIKPRLEKSDWNTEELDGIATALAALARYIP